MFQVSSASIFRLRISKGSDQHKSQLATRQSSYLHTPTELSTIHSISIRNDRYSPSDQLPSTTHKARKVHNRRVRFNAVHHRADSIRWVTRWQLSIKNSRHLPLTSIITPCSWLVHSNLAASTFARWDWLADRSQTWRVSSKYISLLVIYSLRHQGGHVVLLISPL